MAASKWGHYFVLHSGRAVCSKYCTHPARDKHSSLFLITYIFNKISYLDEEDNCTDPSPQLVFPAIFIRFP